MQGILKVKMYLQYLRYCGHILQHNQSYKQARKIPYLKTEKTKLNSILESLIQQDALDSNNDYKIHTASKSYT